MAEASEALQGNGYIIGPGETKEFLYVGELIPFQVNIKNLDGRQGAEYWTQSLAGGKPGGWTLYGTVPAGETVSLLVDWFNSIGVFSNQSPLATIEISGNGIRPRDEAE